MGDRVIEVGLLVRSGEASPLEVSWLVNPERPIPDDARRIHGISDRDVADAPRFATFANQLRETLSGAWLVGHNIRFDVGFLAMELALCGVEVEPAGCLDTAQLAAAVWDLPNYRLDTVASHLRIRRPARHRALEDARTARMIFDRAVAELGGSRRVGMDRLAALHRYVPTWPRPT